MPLSSLYYLDVYGPTWSCNSGHSRAKIGIPGWIITLIACYNLITNYSYSSTMSGSGFKIMSIVTTFMISLFEVSLLQGFLESRFHLCDISPPYLLSVKSRSGERPNVPNLEKNLES
jgi:hypothetical protein